MIGCGTGKDALLQYYYLRRELQTDKHKLAELTELATSITTNLDGMPHGGSISDKTAIAIQIADMRDEIQTKSEQILQILCGVDNYISSIDDSYIRQILTLRYIRRLSWQAVAMSIGGNNTADAVRKASERYFNGLE